VVGTKTIQREHPIRKANEDYPSIILGEPGKDYPLPGVPGAIRRDRILDQKTVIVLGERSGGVRDCLAWWCEVLNSEGIPWAFVQGAQWKPSLILTSRNEDATFKEQIEKVGDLKRASEKADALVELARQVSSSFYFIVRDVGALGDKGAEALAEGFRLIRDVEECPDLRFVVGSDSESYFTDDVFSGVLSMAYRYRLMPLSADEIRSLCGEPAGAHPLAPDPEALRDIVRITGGQPALVQDLLGRLRSAARLAGAREVGKRDVRAVFRLQRRSPPGVTSLWKNELHKLLTERPELVDPMRRYVSGTTLGPARFPPPSHERPLMISGWVKLDQDGRWGISSELHADLARDVLDRLASGGVS
jgi:hypothetical protein